ncbi:hypothetical protein AKO1_015037 [Acrasis kona]
MLGLLCLNALALPRRMTGQWYYIADGFETAHIYKVAPDWLKGAGNTISLAFMNPEDLLNKPDPVPEVFKSVTSNMKALNKTIFFSFGGYGYAEKWSWLRDSGSSRRAGVNAAQIAKKYGVGMEIDYEGSYNPLNGVVSFIEGFRSICPMGECVLSMDFYGSPGGQEWQRDVVSRVVPSGNPGQRVGDGNFLDLVNVMVIDAVDVKTAQMFWGQWRDTKKLNLARATFGLLSGSYEGNTISICKGDQSARNNIDSAVGFLEPLNVYGYMSWAICPPAAGQLKSCADWEVPCNDNAPGFNYLCKKINAC